MIRYKNVRGERMDEAVDALLEELAKEQEGATKTKKRTRRL